MDALLTGNRIANPSGLDARAQGYPPLVRGPRRNAILLNGRDNHVRVSGPAHRHECFGDLDKCPLGKLGESFTVEITFIYEEAHKKNHNDFGDQ
jgi:hypothetical protein